MDALISKGRFQLGQGVLVTIFTIGLFFFSRFLFKNAFSFQYLQIDHLIAAIVFTLLILYIIFKGFEEYKAVNVYENHLKFKWLFGLIALPLDKNMIKQFGQSSIKNINYVYLKTEKYDLLFNENLIENIHEFIEQLREWRVKRKDNLPIGEISKVEKKIGGFALMIAGAFICFGILLGSYINPISFTDIKALTAVSGHLSKAPEVDKSTLRSPSTNVTFQLEEYPSIRFAVGNAGYEAINIDNLSQYKKGDNTTLLISKNDYSKKLIHNSEPTFNEKHFNWNEIQTFEVEIIQQKVLQLEEFNNEAVSLRQSNQKWGLVAIGLAIFVFWVGLKAFRYQIALCNWGTTLLLHLNASISCSSSMTNNIEQQNKQ